MLKKLLVIIAGIVIIAATQATALGLGDITVESALNQPLSGRIELVDVGDLTVQQIEAELASEEDFSRFSLERPFYLEDLSFSVESASDGPYIRVSSRDPVEEPYLSFVVDTNWPNGRLLSEYTVLLDPPGFSGGGATASAQPPTSEVDDSAAGAGGAAAGSSAPADDGQPDNARRLAAVDAGDEQDSSDDGQAGDTPSTDSGDDGNGQSAERARTGEAIEVSDADTLWNIAREVRPDDSVTVQQTMMALQRVNPNAFIDGNINMLRRDVDLRIPTRSEIEQINSSDAVAEVSRQNEAFTEGRSTPASSQPLSSPPDEAGGEEADQQQGELNVVTAEDIPEVDDSAIAEVRQQSNQLEQRLSEMEDQLAVNQEELARVERENEELTERLSMLEEQIATAQEIIELRDQELAQLQEELAESGGGDGGDGDPDGGGPEGGAETDDSQDTQVTMASQPGPAERFMNTVLGNAWALGAIAGIVVLLLVLVMLRRNRASQAQLATGQGRVEDEEFDSDADDQKLFAALGDELAAFRDQDEQRGDRGRSAAGQGHPEGYETEELLGEVEALMDLQKYDRAANMLQNAIVAAPERADLRLKLLEVYVANGDASGFSRQESELSKIADDETREKVRQLRAQLPEDQPPGTEPESGLQEGEGQPAESTAEQSADSDEEPATAAAPQPAQPEEPEPTSAAAERGAEQESTIEMSEEAFSDLDELEFELDMDSSEEVGDKERGDSATSRDLASGEDKETGIGEAAVSDSEAVDETVAESAGQAADEAQGAGAGRGDEGEDFDEWSLVDTDEPTADDEHKRSAGSAGDEEFDFDFDLELTDLDSDTDSDSGQEADTDRAGQQASTAGGDDLGFEFSFDEEDSSRSSTSPQKEGDDSREEADDSFDISLDDFELEDTESGQQSHDAAKVDPGDGARATSTDVPADGEQTGEAAPSDEGDGLGFLSDADEAGTKLDLAHAYIEMGDNDGAREILEEVLREGSEEQVRQGRELLERLQSQ